MTHDELLKGLSILRPGATYTINGDVISWQDEKQTQPSMDEIAVAASRSAYQDLRRKEYPPMGDQLDALWKGGQAVADMKAKIDAVKSKFPKPE